MKKKYFLICFLFFSVHGIADTVSITSTPVHVIVDTDAGIEDMIALLYLIKTPHMDIKAITTVGTGITSEKYVATNVLNLLALAKHPRIPVAVGAKKSLSPVGQFPKKWREEANHVMGIELPSSSVLPVSESSAALMAASIKASPFKMTLFCMGPLTNLAMALQHAPEIRKKIRSIYIAAGALLAKGNMQEKTHPFSEYHIYLDAKAASIVFASGIPIILVPIDAMKQVPVTPSFYDKLGMDHNTPAATFIYEAIKKAKEGVSESIYLGPSLAAALLTHKEIATYRDIKVEIGVEAGKNYGRILVQKEGYPIRVATEIDTEAFYAIFLKTVNRLSQFKLGYNNR